MSTTQKLVTASGLPIDIIYGTAWKKERTEELVRTALLAGFCAIDAACQPKHYAEDLVGRALAAVQKENGISRKDLFVQTKFTSLDGQDSARVPYEKNAPLQEQVRQSFRKSLENLRTDYLDSLVLHGPMRTADENLLVWHVFEQFHREGKVRHLGVSNFYSLAQLTKLYDAAQVKPSIVQNRFYAQTGYDVGIREFCMQHGMVYQSFWTLTANPHVLNSAAAMQMSVQHGITPAQLFFRYVMQLGICPLSDTTSQKHMREDLAVAGMPALTEEEMMQLDRLLFA